MPALREYKVFISHAWEYSTAYERAVDILDIAPNFQWRNMSVPEHDSLANDERIEASLRNQMRPASVFLILAGMYAAHSEWIEFEIAFAQRIGRPIVGVRPWGSERVPLLIQNAATEVVGWSSSSIVRAIRQYALADGL